MKAILISASFVLLAACGQSSFKGATTKPAPRNDAAANPGSEITPLEAPTTVAPSSSNPCAGSTSQSILVLDLKSGWFAGDGGNFFRSVVDGVCGGAVRVTYVHATLTFAEGTADFNDVVSCSGTNDFGVQTGCSALKDIRGYDQLWLLSGDHADPDDLRVASPLFTSIVQRAKELRDAKPKAGFFFGAGLGNVSHANALGQALFSEIAGVDSESALFAPKWHQRGALPSETFASENDLRAMSPGDGQAPGTFDSGAFPFRAFGSFAALTSLFDYEECFGDAIVANGGNRKVVATDRCGSASIAQFVVGGHKIMLEANTARFYGFPEYFSRAVTLLLP